MICITRAENIGAIGTSELDGGSARTGAVVLWPEL